MKKYIAPIIEVSEEQPLLQNILCASIRDENGEGWVEGDF